MTRVIKQRRLSGQHPRRSGQVTAKEVVHNGERRPGETRESRRDAKEAGAVGDLLRLRLMRELKAGDPVLSMVRRVSERVWPRETSKPTSNIGEMTVAGATRARQKRRKKGRWPLDLVRECSGNGWLALRVWSGAGLERYGLSDGDMIFIGFDDPDEGGPALVAIDDSVIIGWYNRAPSRCVTVMPFVEGTEAVSVRANRVQVACSLKCICTFQARVEPNPVVAGLGSVSRR